MKRIVNIFMLLAMLIGYQATARQQLFDSLVVRPSTEKAPLFVRRSPVKLAAYLTENDSSDAQKILNIYNWIIHNISYDYKAYAKVKSRRAYDVKQTLRKRKGLSYQYSNLFTALCEQAGITSLPVAGYTRGQNFSEDDAFYEVTRQWNAVRIDGKWLFVEPTWGSGYLVQRSQWLKRVMSKVFNEDFVYDRYKFLRSPTYTYCFVTAEKMLESHLPADPLWQLVQYPVSVGSFESFQWKGYQYRKDSLYSKALSLRQKQEELERFTRMSPFQYQYRQAFNAYAFNPRNHALIANANYSVAPGQRTVSPDPKKTIAGNKAAMEYLRGASTYCKRHQASINRETIAIRKQSLIQTKVSLERPVAHRIKVQKQKRLRFGKIARQWELEQERYADRLASFEKLESEPIATLGSYSKPNYERRSLVANNRAELVRIFDNVDSLLVVSDTLLLGLRSTVREVPGRVDSLGYYNDMLNQKIIQSTRLMVADRRFGELKQSWQVIDELAGPMDLLDSILAARLVTAQTAYQNIDQLMKSVRAAVVVGQKLVVSNCKLTGGEDCAQEEYQRLGRLLSDSYRKRKEALSTYMGMIQSSYDGLVSAVKLLAKQHDLLLQNSDYVQKFKDNRLANIAFMKAKSLFEMVLLEKEIEKMQNKLLRENLKLARELPQVSRKKRKRRR